MEKLTRAYIESLDANMIRELYLRRPQEVAALAAQLLASSQLDEHRFALTILAESLFPNERSQLGVRTPTVLSQANSNWPAQDFVPQLLLDLKSPDYAPEAIFALHSLVRHGAKIPDIESDLLPALQGKFNDIQFYSQKIETYALLVLFHSGHQNAKPQAIEPYIKNLEGVHLLASQFEVSISSQYNFDPHAPFFTKWLRDPGEYGYKVMIFQSLKKTLKSSAAYKEIMSELEEIILKDLIRKNEETQRRISPLIGEKSPLNFSSSKDLELLIHSAKDILAREQLNLKKGFQEIWSKHYPEEVVFFDFELFPSQDFGFNLNCFLISKNPENGLLYEDLSDGLFPLPNPFPGLTLALQNELKKIENVSAKSKATEAFTIWLMEWICHTWQESDGSSKSPRKGFLRLEEDHHYIDMENLKRMNITEILKSFGHDKMKLMLPPAGPPRFF